MKYLMSVEWWKAAGIRAAKTMFQTGAALVVTQMPVGTVDWVLPALCDARQGIEPTSGIHGESASGT